MTLTWTQLFPSGQTATRRHSITEDRHRHRLVYLGANDFGDDSGGRVQQFDGTNWAAMATRPGDGLGVWRSSAFDPNNNQVVAFGGTDLGGSASASTFICNNLGVWSQVFPTHSPSARFATYMGFAPAFGAIILFGGSGPGPSFTLLNDTWAWTGADWVQLFPATPPSAREGAQGSNQAATVGTEMMIYSDASGLHDTWIIDSVGEWRQEFPAIVPALQSPALCWNPALNAVILLGGSGVSTMLTYAWFANNPTWVSLPTVTSPPFGIWQAVAYDDNLGKVIAAGSDAPGGGTNPQTWALDFPVGPGAGFDFMVVAPS